MMRTGDRRLRRYARSAGAASVHPSGDEGQNKQITTEILVAPNTQNKTHYRQHTESIVSRNVIL